MINILALDTSDEVTGTALYCDGRIIAERNLLLSKKRDELLSSMVKGLLSDCGLGFSDLDGIAIGAGPGSFTGLKVGTAYAKGACFTLNIPLSAVDSLEALALTAAYSDRLIIPMIYARGDEVYYAAFKFDRGRVIRIWDDRLLKYNELAKEIPQHAILLGSGYEKHREELHRLISDEQMGFPFVVPMSPVRWIALLGAEKIFKDEAVEIDDFEPKYFQQFPRSI